MCALRIILFNFLHWGRDRLVVASIINTRNGLRVFIIYGGSKKLVYNSSYSERTG